MAEHHDHWTTKTLGPHPALAPKGGKPAAPSGWNASNLDALVTLIPSEISSDLTIWMETMSTAARELPPMENPMASANFGIALIGNLAWAATCLMSAGSAAVVTMSFVGAAAGSGTFAVDATPKSPVVAIDTTFHKARDAAYAALAGQAKQIAAKIAKSCKPADHEAHKQMIWSSVFKGIPYQNSSALLGQARNAVARAARVYEAQYETWLEKTDKEAGDYAESHRVKPTGWALAKIGDPEYERIKSYQIREIRAKQPFRPNLSF